MSYDTLQEAQTALCEAIDALHAQWGTKPMVYAVAELDEAIDQAEAVLAALPRRNHDEPTQQILAIGLQTLVQCGRDELHQAEIFALEAIGQRMQHEEAESKASEASFPAGTIVSCPQCEHGLYKLTTRAPIEDLVMDDGTLLAPLNLTIPLRSAWTPLSCPLCGGRLFKDGQIHTLQQGWV